MSPARIIFITQSGELPAFKPPQRGGIIARIAIELNLL
jgi:hypothetical protein